MHRARASVTVVIPAKNEALNLPWVLRRMPSSIDEVLIVDGLSTDGTLEVAKMIAPDVVAIHEMQPGKGAAMRAGMNAARGDYIVLMDADGSMDPREIARFVHELEAGADLVKGSRFISGGESTDISWFRRFGNAGLLHFANLLFRTRFTELCYGYMAVRRTALDRLALDATGFEIETQIVTRAVRRGLRIVEVPSSEYRRRNGASNLHAVRDGWRVLKTILREWPIRAYEGADPISREWPIRAYEGADPMTLANLAPVRITVSPEAYVGTPREANFR